MHALIFQHFMLGISSDIQVQYEIFSLQWDTFLKNITHKWASKMCSGSYSFLILRFLSLNKISFYLIEKLFFPLQFVHTYSWSCSTVQTGFCFGVVCRLHWAVIDGRLLVENMEIRQAERNCSPPGELEKNLKLWRFFKMGRWPWKSFNLKYRTSSVFFSSSHNSHENFAIGDLEV